MISSLCFAPVLHDLARYLAAQVAELALQVAHPGLARVIADDLHNRIVLERHVLLAQARLLALLLHQVLPRNLQLLLLGVPLQPQDLHAVLQRSGNRMQHVCRRHKQHLRQVVVHIQVVILERRVLLRIENLKQRARRIAAEVRRHLVHFVQQEHRDSSCPPSSCAE